MEHASPEVLDQNKHGMLAMRVLGATMVLGILAITVLALDSEGIAGFARRLSVGTLAAGAFALIGVLLGFIFGIPRTEEGTPTIETDLETTANQPTKRLTRFHHNTNLEDISDWLTKILVGVGLTQLTTLPENLWALADKIAPGLATGNHAQTLTLSIIIFYATTGFLFGYLWTRLYFKGALAHADALFLFRKVKAEVSELQAQPEKDAAALQLTALQLKPGTETPSINTRELKKAIQQASSSARETIFRQAWDVRSQTWDTNKQQMALTIPVFEALIKATNQPPNHAYHGQLGWALKDKEPPDWERAEKELTTAIKLRDNTNINGWLYYEANRALCRIMMTKDQRLAQTVTNESILEDLRTAAQMSEQHNFTLREPAVKEWLAKEDVNVEELVPSRPRN